MSALTAIAGILFSLLFMIILVGCSYAAYQGQKARNEMFSANIKYIADYLVRSVPSGDNLEGLK